MKEKISACLLVRVSTTKQDYQRQLTDLKSYCERMNYQVVHTIESIVTGTSANKKREDIQELLTVARTGKFQKLIVTEVSRIGRKPDEIRAVLNELHQQGISVVFKHLGVESLDEKGEETLISRLIIAIYSELAANEQQQISERVKSGLAHAKKSGKQLGRPVGTAMNEKEILSKYRGLVKDLRSGVSLRKCERIHSVSRTTIIKVKRACKIAA